MSITRCKPITKTTESGDVEDVYFDMTILINKDNRVSIIDNSEVDYRDYVDCHTLAIKSVKVSVL